MVKSTKQRNAIYDALANSGRPLSVDEVFKLAKNESIGLGIATVYRNLKTLQEQGRIIKVDLPGQAPRWEVIASHHHHFLCRNCDRLFEIYACPENIRQLLPEGYTLEEAYILLRGQCDICTNKTKARSSIRTVRSK